MIQKLENSDDPQIRKESSKNYIVDYLPFPAALVSTDLIIRSANSIFFEKTGIPPIAPGHNLSLDRLEVVDPSVIKEPGAWYVFSVQSGQKFTARQEALADSEDWLILPHFEAELSPEEQLTKMVDTTIQKSFDVYILLKAIVSDNNEIIDYRIIIANDATRLVFPFPPHELPGKTFSEISITVERFQYFRSIFNRAIETGEIINEEYQVLSQPGSPWIHFQIIPLEGGVGIWVRDITSRKLAEAENLHYSERYQLLFEANPLPMFVVEKATQKILTVNDTAIKCYNYSHAEFIRMKLSDLELHDGNTLSNEAFRSEGQTCHITKDGRLIDVEITSQALVFEGTGGWLVMAKDISDKLKAEKDLHQSESNLVALIENTNESVLSLDSNFTILTLNSNFAELIYNIYGLRIEKGDNYLLKLPEEVRAGVKENFDRAMLGERFFVERKYFVKGEERSYALYINPIYQNKKVTGVSYFLHEITESRRIQDTIRKSEEKYRSLIENMVEGVLYMDKEGNVVFANDQFYNMLGYMPGELSSVMDGNILTGEAKNLVKSKLKLRTEGISDNYELTLKRKDGKEIYTLVNGTPLIDSQGNNVGSLSTIIDITQRKQSEEKARQSESQYRKLIETMYEGVLYADGDFNIKIANDRFLQMLEIMNEDLIGKPMYLLFPKPLQRKVVREQKKLRELNQPAKYEARMQKRNGDTIWVLINASPLQDEAGNFIGSLGTFTDITELKNTEERLKSTNMDLNTFVYKASHDLKGPLSSIIGLTELAEKEITDDTANVYMSLIKQGTSRLDRIITDLLDTVKIKEGMITLSEIDFPSLIEEILGSMQHSPNFKRLKITTQLEQDEIFISDKKILTSVIQNLIDNAIKYQDMQKPAPYVHIACIVADGYASLEVEDNGLGINKKLQDKVFSMFFRANHESKGTGLGLFIVKNAVEKLGGTIKLDSNEGMGSKFSINLPGKPGLNN